MESSKTQKLLDKKATDSLKSNFSQINSQVVINNNEKDTISLIDRNNFDNSNNESIKAKVHFLNYFDVESSSYKRLLVKRIQNS
jgi:ABC-type antimicrobial peptide transport system permease subunit